MTSAVIEPTTMAELLEQTTTPFSIPHKGDIVEGTVISADASVVLVDIAGKSEGIIFKKELYGRDEDPVRLVPGERVKVLVLNPEDENGNTLLSLRKARTESVWQELVSAQKSGEAVDADVREQNKGGLIVSVLGVRGFLPSSQVARGPSGAIGDLVGTRVSVKVLEAHRKRNRLIVSQRAVHEADRARQREELFGRLVVGQELEGTVSGLVAYGAFVNIGEADGLVHISELAWERVNAVTDVVSMGDPVRVKVIKLDRELNRISLSLRQTTADPWEKHLDRLVMGAIVQGTVSKIKKYGAFVQIADGVEGLLHISEITWDHIDTPEQMLEVGQEVAVRIIELDPSNRRLSLSLRQAEEGHHGDYNEVLAKSRNEAARRDEAAEVRSEPTE